MSRSKRSSVYLSFKGLMTTRAKLIKLSDLPYICMYCGDPADQREHVTPYSYTGNNTHMVWSCGECNNIAGSLLFSNIRDKGIYINDKLQEKYKKLLDVPQWSDEELGELDGGMKKYVKGMRKVQEWIRNRINWKCDPNVLLVVKALTSLGTGKNSVAQVVEESGMQISELKHLLSIEEKRSRK